MALSKKIIIAIVVAVVLIVALIIYFYTRPSSTKDHTAAHAAAVVAVATGQTPAPVVATPSMTTATVVQPADDGSVAVTSKTTPTTPSKTTPVLTSTTIVKPTATQTDVQSNLAAHTPVVVDAAAVKTPTPSSSPSVAGGSTTLSTVYPKTGGGAVVTSDTAGTVSTTTTIISKAQGWYVQSVATSYFISTDGVHMTPSTNEALLFTKEQHRHNGVITGSILTATTGSSKYQLYDAGNGEYVMSEYGYRYGYSGTGMLVVPTVQGYPIIDTSQGVSDMIANTAKAFTVRLVAN